MRNLQGRTLVRLRSLLVLHAALGACALARGAEPSKAEEKHAPAQTDKAFPDLPRRAEPSPEEAKRIAALLVQLGDDEYTVREAAQTELRALGQKARTQIKKATDTTRDAEVREATQRLLQDLDGEYWEGYYYYSLQTFEDACKQGTVRVRFWMKVKRAEDGSFTAETDEAAPQLGRSMISGKVDRAVGSMTFKKQYGNRTGGVFNGNGNSWNYEGTWKEGKGRIEGTYGPDSGGFVLYPRRLTDRERRAFEAGNPNVNVYDQTEYEFIEEE